MQGLSCSMVPAASEDANSIIQCTCIVMSVSVGLCVCLSVRSYISKTTWSNFAKFFVHVACGGGSVLLYDGFTIHFMYFRFFEWRHVFA